MKVRLKTSLIGTKNRAGDVVNLPDNTAKRLIKENLAVFIEDDKKENKKDSKVNVENRQRQRKRTTKRRTSKNTSKG